MALPTASEITNLYLYGQSSTPTNLEDEALIRSSDESTQTSVSASEYMSVGAGRFASAAFFDIVQLFFSGGQSIAPGRYNEIQTRSLLGTNETFIKLQQTVYSDGKDDYAERSYIWNTVAFEIDDAARFVVDADGKRYIENFAIIPFANENRENFDFESNDLIAILGNPGLENDVDPSRIGRKVEISFNQDIDPTTTPVFDLDAYQATIAQTVFPNPALLSSLPSAISNLVDELWANGTIKTTDSADRPIVYGTEDPDNLSSSVASRSSYLGELVDNGVVYIGGKGEDLVTAGEGDDVLNGGDEQDELFSGQGNNIVFGGAEDDLISAGSGENWLVGNDGNDRFEIRAEFDPNDPIDFDNPPEYGSMIWGGEGADEFHFFGNQRIAIVYVDGLTEENWERLDSNALDERLDDFFGREQEDFHLHYIINPDEDDSVFIDGLQVAGNVSIEQEVEETDFIGNGSYLNVAGLIGYNQDFAPYGEYILLEADYAVTEETVFSSALKGESFNASQISSSDGKLYNSVGLTTSENRINIIGFQNGDFGINVDNSAQEYSRKTTTDRYSIVHSDTTYEFLEANQTPIGEPGWYQMLTQPPNEEDDHLLETRQNIETDEFFVFGEDFDTASRYEFSFNEFAVNEDPEAADLDEETPANEPFSIEVKQLSLKSTDADGDELSLQSVENIENGTLTITGSNGETFTFENSVEKPFAEGLSEGIGIVNLAQDDVEVDISGSFIIEENVDVGNSTEIPHVTINGVGNDSVETFVIDLNEPGAKIIVDVDGADFDSFVEIYDANGELLASNDDSLVEEGGEGSTSEFDSYLEFTTETAGPFHVVLSDFEDDIIAGDAYTVNISVMSSPVAATPPGFDFENFGGGDGVLTFTPDPDYIGPAGFKYTVRDAFGGESQGSLNLTVVEAVPNTAPIVANELADQSSAEDGAISFSIPSDTFSDVDGDQLTLTATLAGSADLPSWLTFDATAREFSGTPPQDFNGSLEVTVTASDGELEASDTFTLEITPVNDAPVVANALADQSSAEDASVSVTLPSDTFSDVDGNQLTLTATLAGGAALPVWLTFDAAAREFGGTPPQNFNGSLDVTVTASDGELEASYTFNLEITPVNDAPIVANEITDQTSAEDNAVSFVLTQGTFSDRDGDELILTATLADGAALPVWLTFDATAREFSGTPPQDFNGSLDVAVTASDGDLEVSDTFTLEITPVNDAPVVANELADQLSAEDASVSFTLPEDSFSDVDGDELTLTATLAGGAVLPVWLTFDAAAREFSGTPPQDFDGSLDVAVTASDGDLEVSDTFTLEITPVNDAPVVANELADQLSAEDASVSFTLPEDSFSDVDGDELTLTATLAGGAVLPVWLTFDAAAREFSGTPPQDFDGSLDVTVTASDGELEATDTFTLELAAVNDAPINAAPLDDQTSVEDQAVSFTLPADSFSDVDGDVLSLSASLADESPLPDWLSFDAVTRTFIGTPPQDFYGLLEIKVLASDGELSASDVFTLEIAAVNDAPVVANAIADQSSAEDASVSFTLPEDSFSDVDGDELTLTATLAGGAVLPVWLTFDAAARAFSGTPPQDFNGSLEVTVTASDGELEVADTFTLEITPVNDAPTVATELTDQSSAEDSVVSFVLPEDTFSDVDGDQLTLTASLAGGAVLPVWLTFDAAAREFSGTPPQDFNGSLEVTVTASDGELETSDTFNLEITPVNDAPVLVSEFANQSSVEDEVVSFTVPSDAFSDIDGDDLSLSAQLAEGADLPSWLTFDAAARSFTGTPPQNFNGTLDVKVTASDGELEVSDTFILEIAPVNDAPIAENDGGFEVTSGQSLTISAAELLANDLDVDGDALTITAVSSSSGNAAVSIDDDGNVLYEATSGFSGTDTFEYTVSDGELTTTAAVLVSVEGGSDPYEGWQQGTDGADLLFGNNLYASNQIYGAGGDDWIFGGFRADQIDGGTGNDRVFGLFGDDTLNGNEGNDLIFGGGGNDTISGGAGNDRLWGGWGQDNFVYASGDGTDRIMDFDTGRSWGWWSSFFSSGDSIAIDVEGIDSFADLMDVASQQGRHTVFDFGGEDKLVLSHTRLAALDQDAFTFF